MIERCLLIASDISTLEVLNPDNIGSIIQQLGNTQSDTMLASRILVTDPSASIIFDTANESTLSGKYAVFPEIATALSFYDVFTWQYQAGIITSRAAVPIVSYGKLIGCVYMMESDPEQGALLQSLQQNIFSITALLEVAVIIFSIAFANVFSSRLRRIQNSIKIIRSGNYDHKVEMGGHDELTMLGDEFNEMSEILSISENKRRRFVSDASHELKTPLASIKLLSDSILQNDMDMQTVREFVSDIGTEADRLNRMSSKLLLLAKIETPTEDETEIINIAPTIDRVVKMLALLASKEKVTITPEIIQDSPVLILEDDLYQILFNLVENAIKYNTPGGEVRIHLSRQKDNAIIKITDTGVGIPEDSISHLFERFYRVDKARSRKSGGSGLGLAIVRNIVERNTGSIEVESTFGKGSTFTVVFPIFETDTEEAEI